MADDRAPDGASVAQVTWDAGTDPSHGYTIDSADSVTARAGYAYTASVYVRQGAGTQGQPISIYVRESTPQGQVVGRSSSAVYTLKSAYKLITSTYVAKNSGDSLDTYIARNQYPNLPGLATNGGEGFYADAYSLIAAAPDVPSPNPTPPCGGPSFGSFGVGNWPPACWRPYADSSFINTPIAPGAPLDPNSSAITSTLLNGNTLNDPNPPGQDGGQSAGYLVATSQPNPTVPDGNVDPARDAGNHPTFWASSSDPQYTVTCDEYGGNCPLSGKTIRIPQGAIPAGYFDSGPSGAVTQHTWPHDAHMTIVDQANHVEHDLFAVQAIVPPVSPGQPGQVTIGWGGSAPVTGSSASGVGGQATAADFNLLAGLIRAPELQAGQINHALVMVVPCTRDPNQSGLPNPVAPVPALGGGTGMLCSADKQLNADYGASAPPMGAHLRINLTVGQINNLPSANFPDWEKAILRALSQYGAYVEDTTGSAGGWGFALEGGTTYTSFKKGQTRYVDEAVNLAKSLNPPVPSSDYNNNYPCPQIPGGPPPEPWKPSTCGPSNGQNDEYFFDLTNFDWTTLQMLQPGH